MGQRGTLNHDGNYLMVLSDGSPEIEKSIDNLMSQSMRSFDELARFRRELQPFLSHRVGLFGLTAGFEQGN